MMAPRHVGETFGKCDKDHKNALNYAEAVDCISTTDEGDEFKQAWLADIEQLFKDQDKSKSLLNWMIFEAGFLRLADHKQQGDQGTSAHDSFKKCDSNHDGLLNMPEVAKCIEKSDLGIQQRAYLIEQLQWLYKDHK